MANQEEQGQWEPATLGEAWTHFETDILTDAEDVSDMLLHHMKRSFYVGALALLAVLARAASKAPDGDHSQAVNAAVEASEEEINAFFEDRAPDDGVMTLKVLEVEAATADELVAKVRELVPLAPEQEEQIRQMHAARTARIAKQH